MLQSSGLLSRFLLVEMKTKMTPQETLLAMTRTTAAPLLIHGANHVTCTICHVTEISSHVIHSELSQPLPEDVWERFCWSLLVTRAWLEERVENSKFSQCIQLNAWFKFEHSTRAIGQISLNKNYRYLKAERSWKIYILCYNALYRKSGALRELYLKPDLF